MSKGREHITRWPDHLSRDQSSTGLARSTRVGLSVTALFLAGLLGLSWSGEVPTAEDPGMTPVASIP